MSYQKKFLKDIVKDAGGKLHLQFMSKGSQQTTQPANGKGFDVVPTTFRIPATGREFVENLLASVYNYDLSDVQNGEHVEAYIKTGTKKNGDPFETVGFRILESSSEQVFTASSQTPQKQVQSERKADQSIQGETEKSYEIGLRGIVQAMITGRVPWGNISANELSENPSAIEVDTWIRDKAKEMAKPKPTLDDLPEPSPDYSETDNGF